MDTTSMSPQSFCSEVYNGVFPDYIPVPSHDQPMFQDTNYALVPQTEIEDSFGRSTFQGHTFCSNHQQVTLFPFGVFGNHGLNYDTFPLQEPYLQQQWGFGDDQIPSLTILPSFPISHESTTSDFLGFRSQGPECTSSPEGSPSSLLDYNTFEMNDDGCSNFAIECNTLITYPDPRGIIDLTQNTENHELNGQCVAHPETFSMMTINTPPHEVQQLGESISDFSELDECTPKIDVSKRKKQYRKKITTTAKPILPKLTYHCSIEGCKITCSSIPSLTRHIGSHKWKGKYQPLRCEGCQNGLSNEYAVQRHITRSEDTVPCRRMSVYSIMKSCSEIETTVRFYRDRPHGKKTVQVNLEEMKAIYLNDQVTE